MTIKVEGAAELIQAIQKKIEEVRKSAQREILKSAYRVHAAAVKRIASGPAGGRVYELYSPRRTHKASAAGEAPMTDTGALVSNSEVRAGDLEAWVVFKKEHALYLEFGTSRIQPRPFLVPSVEEETPALLESLRGLL
jgi:HK97 gp10 family phage protein